MRSDVVPPPSALAEPGADAAPAVRPLATLAEYRECVAIQEETWGAGFAEAVPPSMLLVAQKVGGVVAGAFAPDGRMLGFVFGLTGVADGGLTHWSHLLAVRDEARGRGIGERLKRCQRDLVAALGVETIRWTFDPLVARNAHLNLVRLGARAAEYVPDMYGTTGSPLHGGVPTDRLVAVWDLPGAVPPPPPAPVSAPLLAAPGADGAPPPPDPAADVPDAPVVRIAVPRDAHALAPADRAAWRAATRAAFLACLGRGYTVVGFHRGDGDTPPSYELARPAD